MLNSFFFSNSVHDPEGSNHFRIIQKVTKTMAQVKLTKVVKWIKKLLRLLKKQRKEKRDEIKNQFETKYVSDYYIPT